MKTVLYFIAMILVITWAICIFAYHTGGLTHLLLIVAVVALLLNVIRGNKPLRHE